MSTGDEMRKTMFNYNDTDRLDRLKLKAEEAAVKWEDKITNKDYAVIIDMKAPSYQKRFFVFDCKQGKLIRQHHVAHGVNSNSPSDRARATRFSNKWMSKQTSLGAFVTGKTYYGKHGRSLNLHGLEKGVNDNAFKRRVVIHKAKYVTDGFILRNKRAGNSWGCPALDPAVCQTVIDLIKGGAFVYVAY